MGERGLSGLFLDSFRVKGAHRFEPLLRINVTALVTSKSNGRNLKITSASVFRLEEPQ